MAGTRWARRVVWVGVWAGLIWLQQWEAPVSRADGVIGETISVDMGTGSRANCEIIKSWAAPGGYTGYLVRSADTGKTMTVLYKDASRGQLDPTPPGQKGGNLRCTSAAPPLAAPPPLAAAPCCPPRPTSSGCSAGDRLKGTGCAAVPAAGRGEAPGQLQQVAGFETAVQPAPVAVDNGPAPAEPQGQPGAGDPSGVERKVKDVPEPGMSLAEEDLAQAALQARMLAEQQAKAVAALQARLRAAQEARRAAQEAKEKAEIKAKEKAELVAQAVEASARAEQEAEAKAEEAAKAEAELEGLMRAAQAKARVVKALTVQPVNGLPPATVGTAP